MAEKITDKILSVLGIGKAKPSATAAVPPEPAPSASAAARQADFDGVLNPKRVIEKRLKAAEEGMACGGKVKRMAGGGSVRGSGCAIKGQGKGKFC